MHGLLHATAIHMHAAAPINMHPFVRKWRTTFLPAKIATGQIKVRLCLMLKDVPQRQSNWVKMAALLQHLQRGAAAVEAGAVLAAIRLQRPEKHGVPPGRLDSVSSATRNDLSSFSSMHRESGMNADPMHRH